MRDSDCRYVSFIPALSLSHNLKYSLRHMPFSVSSKHLLIYGVVLCKYETLIDFIKDLVHCVFKIVPYHASLQRDSILISQILYSVLRLSIFHLKSLKSSLITLYNLHPCHINKEDPFLGKLLRQWVKVLTLNPLAFSDEPSVYGIEL